MAADVRADGRRALLTRLVLAALVVVYLATVLPNLGNQPIVGGDEGWIISSAAKLAQHGVFGSDLFAGFYSVQDHYFFNLPLHHMVLAAVFELLGAGIEQARLVSVVAGLAVLLLTYAFGRRVGGACVGLLAATLIVLLRLNLAPFSGLTLTDLGATVRYDLVSVPFGLGAALLLARQEQPSPVVALLAGVLVGLGGLVQFLGLLFAAPLAVFLLTLSLPPARRVLLIGLLGAGIVLVFIPYGVYAAAHWDDFRGQSRALEQRTDLLSPSFYVYQLRHEPHRYGIGTDLNQAPSSLTGLVARPSARLALLVLGPIAAVYAAWRGRQDRLQRLLALLLIGLALELAISESTKRFVYWVVVVPFLCVALAGLMEAAWGARPGRLPSWAPRAAVALVLGVFLLEGLAVAARDLRSSGDVSDYDSLGRRIEASLPPNAVVLGDNRLWPALPHEQLRSLLLLFYHTNPYISRERTTDIPGALQRIDPDYVLLSPLSRDILSRLSPRDSVDFARFLSERTQPAGSIPDRTYGPIDVYRVLK